MPKKFNITGTCIPEKHFMVDISGKVNQIMKLVENGDYFAINRPRQYGKTTFISILKKTLNKNPDYLVSSLSFEGVGDIVFNDEKTFAPFLIKKIADGFFGLTNVQKYLYKAGTIINNLDDFSNEITKFKKNTIRKLY